MPTGRFAPSPTGPLHVGNLRTALLAWLLARSSRARFLMRIEDLDPVAASDETAKAQLADLAALGIDWDGETVHQSERGTLYDGVLASLETRGLLYKCYCSRREVRAAASAPHGEGPPVGGTVRAYPGTCRDLRTEDRAEHEAAGRRPALRVRAGGAEVTVADRLYGSYTTAVDDFVVRRADGTPAYQLAVVVDDAHQGIDQVVRGDDLLASTPRQVWLARNLDLPVPEYIHVPLVVGSDGQRLAKRHGAVTLDDLRARGVEPGDLVRAMAASLGLDGSRPVASAADLVRRFDLGRLPRDPWVFDPAALSPGGGAGDGELPE